MTKKEREPKKMEEVPNLKISSQGQFGTKKGFRRSWRS